MKNVNRKFSRQVAFGFPMSLMALLAITFSSVSWAADSPVLSDTPIANTTSVQVKPNIMLLMDTSNSMKFSHMPDEIEVGSFQNPNDPFPIGYKSYQCNILYYKPSQTYTLPKDSSGGCLLYTSRCV